MKLADLKRIAIGTQLRLVHCLMGPIEADKQLRIVAKVQGNAIAFSVPHRNDRSMSWLYFPKASEFRDDTDGFSILKDTEIAAQYKF
jgi:hypothetical protein